MVDSYSEFHGGPPGDMTIKPFSEVVVDKGRCDRLSGKDAQMSALSGIEFVESGVLVEKSGTG